MTQAKLFEPILNIVVETMPRDNLLNSACLEFFEFIKKENIKNIISHLVENYRETLQQITYVETFSNFIMRYDQSEGFAPSLESSFMDNDDTPRRSEAARGSRWEAGIKDLDAQEEEYFNTSDDEDEGAVKASGSRSSVNGASPLSKPLVDYPSDEENENMEIEATGSDENTPPNPSKTTTVTPILSAATLSPPEKVSEKRRREDEDEDEMTKLSHPKRRNSTSSVASNSSSMLRRKKSFNTSQHNGASPSKPNKISISISQAIKSGGESSGDDTGS